MNKRQRKKRSKPIATCKVKEIEGVLAEDLLYKPVTYDTKRDFDFEHIMVPFKIQGDKLFIMEFMSSCDLSVYLKCYHLNEGRLSGYCDVSAHMKECLEMQETMGIEYYFGRLNKGYNQYMYALNVFVNKGLIDSEKALELIRDVGFDESRVDQAVQSVEFQLAKNVDKQNVNAAGDAMLAFFKAIAETSN